MIDIIDFITGIFLSIILSVHEVVVALTNKGGSIVWNYGMPNEGQVEVASQSRDVMWMYYSKVNQPSTDVFSYLVDLKLIYVNWVLFAAVWQCLKCVWVCVCVQR